MKIEDYIVEPDVSVIEAMKIIERNGKGIVYLCNKRRLQGVLTDGDIRRYIIQNGDLRESVSLVSNNEPHYLLPEEDGQAQKRMGQYGIHSIPLLNSEWEIVKIFFRNSEYLQDKEQLRIPVVIMAGGKGTRLAPYTQILPKPLIPIGNKTITEHIIDRFTEYGCTHFDMVVNYKKNFIKSYFGDSENKFDISFIEETDYLGTGGGLKLLEGRYPSTFFMSNCDILIEDDYAEILKFHKEKGNMATMVCAEKHITIPYGTVETTGTGRAVCLCEKPEMNFLTNTGFYVLEPEFLHEIPADTFVHITDVLQKCIDKGFLVGAYSIPEEHWMDMGQLDELEKMKKRLEEA